MADNLDSPDLGSFGIQDTMEMGMGNSQLIQDLLAPEGSTVAANPDDIKAIDDDKGTAPVDDKKPADAKPNPLGDKAPAEPAKKDLTDSDFLSQIKDDDEDDDDGLDTDGNKKPIVEPKKPVDDSDDDDEPNPNNLFSAFSEDLFKIGAFTKEDGEEDVTISTPEEFLERLNSEKRKGAIEMVDNFLGQFGEDYKQAFDAIFVKGVDPKEYFSIYNNVVSYAEMDLSIEDNQIKVMRQALSEQGFDAEDVETEIQRIKNYGDLEQVASKHHKVLVRKEASKLEEAQENSARQLQAKAQQRALYNQNVSSVLQEKLKTKDFDGIPFNQSMAKEVEEYLLVDKWKTPSGEVLTDFDKTILDLKRPENHATKVKVALLLKILEKDPTLSTIQKKGVTQKTDDLFGSVAKYASKGTGTSKPGAKRSSYFDNL